jgi:hypothetical protein
MLVTTKPKSKKSKSLFSDSGPIEYRMLEVPIKSFFDQVKDTKVDLSFNRGGGWDSKRRGEFLTTMEVYRVVLNPIYICDCRECLKNAPDQETKDYFSNILFVEKKDYLSVDGNNRSQTIYNNEELSKECLSGVPIFKITKIKKSSIPALFRALNSHLAQSNQVMRNTTSTDITSIVVDMTKSIDLIVNNKKYFKNIEVKKTEQEFITRCLMITNHHLNTNTKDPIPLNKVSLDTFYKDGLSRFNSKTVLITRLILNRINNIIYNNPVDIQGTVFLLSIFSLILFEYKNTLIDDKKFIDTVLEMDGSLRLTNDIYRKSLKDSEKSSVMNRNNLLFNLVIASQNRFIVHQ